MTAPQEDMVLAAFMASATEHAPDLPVDLLLKAYAIQNNHRFDREEEGSLQEMGKLIEDFLNQPKDEGTAS